ncbi:hypothetical protein GGI05_000205 [Coemansia sp. RSA 2603]|nr:hypothetical protein GGI05_000205 [Coemansia sp. RSA 2603]
MTFPTDHFTPSKTSGKQTTDLVESCDNAQSRTSAQSTAREKLRARREELASSLKGETMDFATLISCLSLESEYELFKTKSANICDGLCGRIPTLVKGKFCTQNNETAIEESMLVQWFEDVYHYLKSLDHTLYLSSPPRNRYIYNNHETSMIPNTSIKPDGVIFYGDLRSKNIETVHLVMEAKVEEGGNCTFMEALGQMAEYAHCIWKAQPTRVFVPVIYLYGASMDIMLFARCGYRRISLGEYLYNSRVVDKDRTDMIVDSICDLWFLLIQPPEKFGHFVGISGKAKKLLFQGDKKLTTVKRVISETEDTLEIKGRIPRTVGISLRTAYLLVVKYKGNDAVLKLAWTPVERQPEGALYDILQHGEVDYIPHIYRSGIIVSDFLGYRLEYILMEHCGKPLASLFKTDVLSSARKDKLFSDAGNVIRKVCACLLQAAKAGVFHRDVSAGNITIRDDKVFLIDWGFGKVVSTTLSAHTKERVNSDWNISLDTITRNEDARDGVTGTVLFMGIRVLMGLTSRSVFDDIESILYVVLVALSSIGSSKSLTNISEMGKVCHRNQAIWKFGCMADSYNYLSHFGVSECSKSLRQQLDALREMLFVKNGEFVGGKLLSDCDDMREVSEDVLRTILGDAIYDRCFSESRSTVSNDEESSSSLKRKFEKTAITDTDSAMTSKMPRNEINQENIDPDDVFRH